MTRVCCPCCLGEHAAGNGQLSCPNCGHRWRQGAPTEAYYAALQGRNAVDSAAFERKTRERLDDLRPHLTDGMRMLEIGCAEGEFGARVKSLADVTYVGIELSADAALAAARIDQVCREPAREFRGEPFDLILAFHVLEHIADAGAELGYWRRLLRPTGRLLIEIPNGSGNPLLDHDANPEHVHQFTPASLLMLTQRAGLDVLRLTVSHYESPLYCDSLRLLAAPPLPPVERAERLRKRFQAHLGERFVVYGAGGDFRNYVEPLLPQLPVAAICDSDAALHGRGVGRYVIAAYDRSSLRGLPVLVASGRHHDAIAAHLLALGVPAADIHGLDEIYGADQ